ncbi:MAG: translation initiation factor IF-2 [Desulfotomaculales bacterium]
MPKILREERREEREERLTGLERRLVERTRPVSVVEPAERKPIVIGERITVQELAQKMHKGVAEVIKRLMMLGMMVTINQEIDADTAAVVASEFGYEVQVKPEVDLEALLAQEPEEDPSLLEPRPCVVTVMGHVDHGKTSLLDAIRQTNVTATEAGGITQHIGAYQVEYAGKKITFIDTPGHEAFAAMRARGAKVTDIAVLVVAADDGVMPQTVEAINHCRAANVPIIVAINKIDKPDANPERVKQQLTEYGLVPEEWGGDTICVPVSAVRGDGLSELLEMILLVAEMMDLKANPHRPARGTVIEAELDKGRGPVATVLVQTGTLEVGNAVVAGAAYGRVRAMMDHQGRRLKKAGPSVPVEVLGLSEVPQAGDAFYVVQDERFARQVAARRQLKRREEELKATTGRTTLDEFLKQGTAGQVKELPIIIKGDVHGTVEALRVALERLGTDEVRVNVIHSGVGAITETDIMLASASRAIILGFNVRPDVNARRAAEAERVDIRLYRVIYDVVNDVKAALSGLLEPEYREVFLGRAEVRKIFKVSKVGTIAGCYVHEGKVTRDAKVRLVRDGVVVYEGKIDSLKRFKDDVREVSQGFECGLTLEKFNDIQEGDIIEAYTVETVKRELA